MRATERRRRDRTDTERAGADTEATGRRCSLSGQRVVEPLVSRGRTTCPACGHAVRLVDPGDRLVKH